MRSKPKLWLVLTVIAGLLTTGLVYVYLQRVQMAAVVEEEHKVAQVVAAVKIPEGTKLTLDMLKTVEVPDKYSHSLAVTNPNDALGQFATVDLWPDEILLTAHLSSVNATKELPYKIPEGTRAITIGVNLVSGVAGHIKPGYYVDLLISYKLGDRVEDLKTVTLLQKILVLAVGPDLVKQEGVQESENITLAVTPKDAQLVALAEATGRIKLTLRPAGESGSVGLPTVDIRNLRTP